MTLKIINLSEQRQIRAGTFGRCGKMIIKPMSFTPEEAEKWKAALLKLVRVSICGCWEWEGRIHNGYATCSGPGSTQWAHRVSYAVFNGPIKAGMHIDHICRNRICIRPDHLRQVTPQENYAAIHERALRDSWEQLDKLQRSLW